MQAGRATFKQWLCCWSFFHACSKTRHRDSPQSLSTETSPQILDLGWLESTVEKQRKIELSLCTRGRRICSVSLKQTFEKRSLLFIAVKFIINFYVYFFNVSNFIHQLRNGLFLLQLLWYKFYQSSTAKCWIATSCRGNTSVLHTGHSCLSLVHSAIHCQQKRCPHGVDEGVAQLSKQSAHFKPCSMTTWPCLLSWSTSCCSVDSFLRTWLPWTGWM